MLPENKKKTAEVCKVLGKFIAKWPTSIVSDLDNVTIFSGNENEKKIQAFFFRMLKTVYGIVCDENEATERY